MPEMKITPKKGLSPRLRGNPSSSPWRAAQSRSIPAPAGEPLCPVAPRSAPRVYPRACGGTPAKCSWSAAAPGLSPRLRGNPRSRRGELGANRSIPAPAGEPCGMPITTAAGRVYPRACGGTHNAPQHGYYLEGLSPRLRGNRGAGAAGRILSRSIPAPAGEPTASSRRASANTVYPRACGGTPWAIILCIGSLDGHAAG